MISLRNVGLLGDQNKHILKNINLDISAGEFATVVGRSGSGKSTLLNLITGIDFASEGDVNVVSRRLHRDSFRGLDRWRGLNVGLVFQFFHLIPTLNALENVVLAMDLCRQIKRLERVPRAMALLDQLGLAEQAKQFPNTLSGGEQQRVAIARALANDPGLLLADEPTGNLDSSSANLIYSLLRDIHKSGKTIVMVTHDSDAEHLGNRHIQLQDGQIKLDKYLGDFS